MNNLNKINKSSLKLNRSVLAIKHFQLSVSGHTVYNKTILDPYVNKEETIRWLLVALYVPFLNSLSKSEHLLTLDK